MNYPLLDAFLTMLWFFLWILWIFLLIRILMDIFRSDDMNGWAKAAWTIFIIVLPLLGVLVYLIARGTKMGQREAADARKRESEFRDYVKQAAGPTTSPSEELSKLASLRQQGVISDSEFASLKAKIVS